MSLTAREWLLLPKEEQEKRKAELSSEECFKLRTLFSEIYFTEEQKATMTEKEKEKFLHPRKRDTEEKESFNKKTQEIFKKMIEETKKAGNESK